MAHIDLGVDEERAPGIVGLLQYRPETGRLLNALAETLLRSEPHPLSRGERELIAAYVSGLNECTFCLASHSAFAALQLEGGMPLVNQVHVGLDAAPVSDKLRALLRIAGAARADGRTVTPALVEAARDEGATDLEIHDTVLIAATFSMFNRYVDGLGTVTPDDPQAYLGMAHDIVENGYRH